jgi:hypothetical protein
MPIEEEEPRQEKFIYIAPPKQDEVPKDIMSIELLKIDLQKQCFLYKVKMPNCSKYNQFKGLFLRAPEGEGPFELTLEVSE